MGIAGVPLNSPQALEAALTRWSARLGAEYVTRDPLALEQRARSTLPSAPKPLALLRPEMLAEVVDTVGIANQFGIPLYPISTGRNWGYGDACPVTEGQVILDLGRMNRIIEVNEELAYTVIEPGVTQGQFTEYLRERALKLWLDCTGAGPHTSIVGNVLERGFGHTSYGNRVQTISGMQIVLADGRVLETGFGHYRNARTTRLFSSGVGPMLDGIFTQSNMGIVTQMGLWLMPAPECAEMFACFISDHDAIGPVIDALRRLRLDGTTRSVMHIANDLRLISSSQRFPWHATDGTVPLPEVLRQELKLQAGIGAWALSGMLTGRRGQVAASRTALRQSLRGPGRKLMFFTERKIEIAQSALGYLELLGWGSGLQQRLRSARAALELNRGQPTGEFLAGAYWRNRRGLPEGSSETADPARDRCGLIWLSPVLPMTGAAVLEFYALVEPIYQTFGFELLLTLTTFTDRALGAAMTIAYDKANAEETIRAQRCYETLFRTCADSGYLPYRIGIQTMAELDRGSTVFWDVAGAIKRALDPGAIIAPGRYQPAAARGQG